MKHLKKPTKQDEIIDKQDEIIELLKEIRDNRLGQNGLGQIWCDICKCWIFPKRLHSHQVTYQEHT